MGIGKKKKKKKKRGKMWSKRERRKWQKCTKRKQRDSMLNPLVIDDKSKKWSPGSLNSKTETIFGKKCDLKCNFLENLISLIIVFKPHYKLIKSIADLSFMTIWNKNHSSKESTNHLWSQDHNLFYMFSYFYLYFTNL